MPLRNVIAHVNIKSCKKERYVILSNGKRVEYEYLINTIPLNKFLELTGDNNNLLNKLSYNKVLVFNLGFNKKSKLVNEHWLYIPDKNCNYYRIGFYDNILNQDKLSMYVEIGYTKDSNITKNEIDKQLKLTIENLRKQDIIDDDTKLEEYVFIIMDPAYVHINTETDKMVKKYFDTLRKNNIYSIGRYGAWTYCSMEDCMITARTLANLIK